MILVIVYYILVALLAIGFFSVALSSFSHGGTTVLQGGHSNLNDVRVAGNVESVPETEPEAFPEEEPLEEPEEEPEPLEEPEEEPEPLEEPEPVRKYYTFDTTNSDTPLNVRVAPDIDAKRIYRLQPGTKGYVLGLGDEWSYVYIPSKKGYGYVFNEYLSMTEVSEEEFPEELRDITGPAEE